MEEQLKTILELFALPAFLAQDDVIVWRNNAAASLLYEGFPLHSIFENENTLFSKWSRTGSLNLSVFLGGVEYEATVLAYGKYDMFITSKRREEADAEAQIISSLSASLRKQLHSMVNAADSLFEQLPEQYSSSDAAAALNQTIYRFVRLCGQMTDGSQLLLNRREAKKEHVLLDRFLSDLVAHALPLVASVSLELCYEPCEQAVSADVDPALLERAIYNLIANAIAFTPKGGRITLKTEKQDKLFLISVIDGGDGISPVVSATLFRQFSDYRIGDARRGLGLGLPIVREIARLHGGSLTVYNRSDPAGTVATFSISLSRAPTQLRSPTVRYNYNDEFDRGLVELSEVLAAKMFNPNDLQ